MANKRHRLSRLREISRQLTGEDAKSPSPYVASDWIQSQPIRSDASQLEPQKFLPSLQQTNEREEVITDEEDTEMESRYTDTEEEIEEVITTQVPIEEEVEETESESGYTSGIPRASQSSPLYSSNHAIVQQHPCHKASKNRRHSMPNLDMMQKRKSSMLSVINDENSLPIPASALSTPTKLALSTVSEEDTEKAREHEEAKPEQLVVDHHGSIDLSALLSQQLLLRTQSTHKNQSNTKKKMKKQSILPPKNMTLAFDDCASPAPPSILQTKHRDRLNQSESEQEQSLLYREQKRLHETPNFATIHAMVPSMSKFLRGSQTKTAYNANDKHEDDGDEVDRKHQHWTNDQSPLIHNRRDSMDSSLLLDSRRSSYHRKKMTKNIRQTNKLVIDTMQETVGRLYQALPSPATVADHADDANAQLDEEEEEEEVQPDDIDKKNKKKKKVPRRRSARLAKKSENKATQHEEYDEEEKNANKKNSKKKHRQRRENSKFTKKKRNKYTVHDSEEEQDEEEKPDKEEENRIQPVKAPYIVDTMDDNPVIPLAESQKKNRNKKQNKKDSQRRGKTKQNKSKKQNKGQHQTEEEEEEVPVLFTTRRRKPRKSADSNYSTQSNRSNTSKLSIATASADTSRGRRTLRSRKDPPLEEKSEALDDNEDADNVVNFDVPKRSTEKSKSKKTANGKSKHPQLMDDVDIYLNEDEDEEDYVNDVNMNHIDVVVMDGQEDSMLIDSALDSPNIHEMEEEKQQTEHERSDDDEETEQQQTTATAKRKTKKSKSGSKRNNNKSKSRKVCKPRNTGKEENDDGDEDEHEHEEIKAKKQAKRQNKNALKAKTEKKASRKKAANRKRKASETNSEPERKRVKRLSQYVEAPKSSTPSHPNLRRSKRVRFKPLAFWANERIEHQQEPLTYEKVKTSFENGEASEIIQGGVNELDHWCTKQRKGSKRTRSKSSSCKGKQSKSQPKKKSLKRHKKNKQTMSEDDQYDDDDEEDSDQTAFDGTAWVYDSVEDKMQQKCVVKTKKCINLVELSRAQNDEEMVGEEKNHNRQKNDQQPASKRVRGAKGLEESSFSCGVLEIPPSSQKDEEVSYFTEQFFVHQCERKKLVLKLGDETFRLSRGSMFFVPPENEYSLQNLSETHPARLIFTLIKTGNAAVHANHNHNKSQNQDDDDTQTQTSSANV